MLFFNFIAITIGVLAVFILSYRSISPPTEDIERLTFRLALFFEPLGFVFIVFVTLIFERPIRRYLNLMYRKEPIPREIEIKTKENFAKPLRSSKNAVRMDGWENMKRNRARYHEKYRSNRTKYRKNTGSDL
jgi:hypothetical protein